METRQAGDVIWFTLFWVDAVLVIYVYFGYPALLVLLTRWRKAQSPLRRHEIEPSVSLIVAARNEEQTIGQKIENSLAFDYPRGKLEITIVSDGSTDNTAQIVREYTAHRVQLLDLPHNIGKAAAQNEAVKQANGDILFFTDAEIFLQPDAVRNMIRHFQDGSVGCVVGKVTYLNESETGVSEGEGFYWRYELFLRQKESELGNLAMGSGSIMAVRRKLFAAIDPAVSEDFVMPMKAAIEGYRTVYEPEAIGRLKLFQVGARDMFKTRIRTITLDTRSVFLCRKILNILRYPFYAWGLISHKLLRWCVPYFLLILIAVNLLLLEYQVYRFAFTLQVIFYFLAVLGYFWQGKGNPPIILSIPFSFCLVNLAALVGVARFAMGKKAGRWQPVR